MERRRRSIARRLSSNFAIRLDKLSIWSRFPTCGVWGCNSIGEFLDQALTLSLAFVQPSSHHSIMKLILSMHNLTKTYAIEEHVISRIQKLEHLDHFAINARVTLEHDHTKAPERQFSCSIRLEVPGP